MRYLAVIFSLMFLVGCGSSSGGSGGSDLSCAPAADDLVDPTVDLDGSWTLALTETSSTCDYPPSWIDCTLSMSVSGNDVSITGSCLSSAGVTVNLSNLAGKISGATLYWGATMSETVDTYTETDTVPCNDVAFTSSTESETFSVTVSVSWSDSGLSDTCSTSFSGQFTSS